MDFDKVCEVAKKLVEVLVAAGLTNEEQESASALAAREMSNRYIATLRVNEIPTQGPRENAQ